MAGTACGLAGSVRHTPGFQSRAAQSVLPAPERLGGFRKNLRGTSFSKWPIAGRTGTFIGDAYQSWDWYAAKPDRNGFELYLALDDVFDSVDQNLGSERPAFFRAAFGWTLRAPDRWNIGVE